MAAARVGRTAGSTPTPAGGSRRLADGSGKLMPEQVPGASSGDQGLGQGIGREAVGSVHAGRCGFPDGVEPGDRGPPVHVGPDAAAGVVRAGRDRDRLGNRVDPPRPAQGRHRGEVSLQRSPAQRGGVQRKGDRLARPRLPIRWYMADDTTSRGARSPSG